MRWESTVATVIFLVQMNPIVIRGFAPPSTLVASRGCGGISQGWNHNYEAATTTRWSSNLFGPDDDDENMNAEDMKDKQQREGGEALAKQFNAEIRKRQGSEGSSATRNREEISTQTNANFPSADLEGELPVTNKKFTGASSFPAPEPPPFGSNSGPGNFRGQRQTPREQMMEREFQLVGRAEKGLTYQAIFTVCALIFVAYVGLTGGITSEDVSLDIDMSGDLDYDIVLPVPRDSEASYWL